MKKTTILPVFPLDTVLFPGHLIPLKIFEERYQKLIEDLEETGERKFIIALISSGKEVGQSATPFRVGTEVEYESVIQSNGLSFISPTGIRRVFMPRFIRDEKPYLMAEVEPYQDDPLEEGSIKTDLATLEKKLSQWWISGGTVQAKEAFSKLLPKKQNLSMENFNLYLCGSVDMPPINHQHLLEHKSGAYRIKTLLHILKERLKTEDTDAS